jgi:hypothetical protein
MFKVIQQSLVGQSIKGGELPPTKPTANTT